jgi:MFS family permease
VRSLVEGLSFVRVQTIILVLLSLDSATMLLGSYQVLLPVLAGRFDMGPAGYGLLASAPAIGGFTGALTIMYLGDFPYKGRLISAAFFAYAGCLAAMALAPAFPVAFAVAIGLGLSDSLQAATRNAVVQLMTPDHLRGRVSSFQSMLTGGVPALGQGLLGAAAGLIGAPIALLTAAVICATFNLGMTSRRPDLRARNLGATLEYTPATGGEASLTRS